jgi:PAS domain S-box-containing protein
MSAASVQILLVENHEGDARLLQELLAAAGVGRFRVIHADRLSSGLISLSRPGIDVILLDLSLPDSQGTETLVRMHEASNGIPIVALTGLDDEELGLQLIQTGAQDYLVKGQVTGPLLTRALWYAVERKRLEGEIREKTRLLQTVLHSMADGVVMADEAGRFRVWNLAAERILGAGPSNVGIDRWPEHYGLFLPDETTPYPTEDLPLVRAIRGESVTNIPVFLRRPDQADGTWLSVNARPMRDENGHLSGGVAVFHDITDRKREEEERQKLAKDRLLLESTGKGIYGMDRQGRCTFMNRAAAKMLGYWTHEVLGKDMHHLIHHSFSDGADYPRERCYISATVSEGKGCQVEDEVYWRKDGTSFPVVYSSFPILEQGEITGAVVIFVDRTARRRLEEERSQRAGRLIRQQSALTGLTQSRFLQSSLLLPTLQHITGLTARTLNVMRVSIWRYTDDRQAIHCVDLFDLGQDRHLAGMKLPVTAHPTYFQTLATSQIIAADDAQTDKRTAEFSTDYLQVAGITSMMDVPIYLFGQLEGVICHEHVGTPRRWTEDEQMFAVAVSNLVALAYEQGERRRAEEQLQQSQNRLRSLTARVESVREEERIRIAREIHDELGQALTGVKLELSLLRDQLPQAPLPIVDTLQAISALVDATIQSVRRIATELRPVVLDQLGLIPAIEWQAREFQSRTGIQCTLDIYLRSVSLSQAGSTAMFRIFQEILTNVARHAQASSVNINLQEQAGGLVLEVRDNGRGVTEAELADPKSLGLVGMRERALLLGGEATIQGAVGKGTTVKVKIPLDEMRPE